MMPVSVDFYKNDRHWHWFLMSLSLCCCRCLFKVPPAELEAILDAHPAVADSCVVGIMHPDDGEVPKAFVALKRDAKVTKEELQQFVAGYLTA